MRNMVVIKYAGILSGLEEQHPNTVSISPNPFDHQLEISEITNQTSIRIVNHLGQVVFTHELQAPTTALKMPSLSQGVYYYQILDNKGNITSGKLIHK